MKKISIIISAIAAMFFAAEANAQLGIGAGYNFETMTTKVSDSKSSDNLNGFYLEAYYGIPLAEGRWGAVGIQPGVRYSYFGKTDKSDEVLGFVTKTSLTEHYLDVPVNFRYSFKVATPVRVFAFAAPVFSFGLDSASKLAVSGHDKEYSVTSHNYSGKIVTKGDNISGSTTDTGIKDYGWFDLKIGLGAGVTLFDILDVKVGYNFGLLNRYTGDVDGYRRGTNVFTAGVAVNF